MTQLALKKKYRGLGSEQPRERACLTSGVRQLIGQTLAMRSAVVRYFEYGRSGTDKPQKSQRADEKPEQRGIKPCWQIAPVRYN